MDRPLARIAARFRDALKNHREFVLILVLATAFRLMAVLVFRPGGYVGVISEFHYYRLLSSFTNQGFFPYVDFWIEYPPLFPWLLIGLYRLSLLIPAWHEAGAWFFVVLGMFFTLVEAGNLALFYGIARRLNSRERAVHLSWIYVLLLIPVLSLFTAFDNLAVLFVLWTILLTLDGRPLASGITTGLGFMTKLVPVVAAPAAWQHMRRWPQRVRFLLAAGLVVLLIALPFLITGPDFLIQSFTSLTSRSSWETVWALLDGYYSYGIAGGVDRFDPAQAGAAQHPSQLPWTLLTIGFGLLFLALYTRQVDWSNRRKVVAFTALTQSLLFLYAKGYSPQFLVMLLPFPILLLPGWRGVAYALLLSALNLVEYPLYFVVLPDEPWLLTGTVLLRTLILIILGAEYAAQVYDWRVPQRWWARTAAGTVALVTVLGLVGGILGFQAYWDSRFAASPHRAAMDVLHQSAAPGSVVLTDDQEVFEQLYPFLHRRFQVMNVEPLDYLPPWEARLAEVAAGRAAGELWLYAQEGSPLHDWLAARFPSLADHSLEGWRLTAWDTR
ncbi:MAG: glycosyltransferase 87 family protein [Anaerolineae bacterium]|nr:glycosyltransferase 87 family protein [Anaerolineae bacterium]